MQITVFLVTVACVAAPGVLFAQSKASQTKDAAGTRQHGVDETYITQFWAQIREGNQKYPEVTLRNRIKNNGLAFTLTCMNLGNIRAAGASESFLTFLQRFYAAGRELNAVSSGDILAWLGKPGSVGENDFVNRINGCGLAFNPSESEMADFRKNGASEFLLGAISAARPLDKDVVLSALKSKENVEELVSRVRTYGVTFPRDFEDLSQAGGPPALYSAIAETRWFTKPLPPPAPQKGWLIVICQPVDCDVEVNGNPAGPTQGGALKASLDAADAVVSVKKDGYVPSPPEGKTVAIKNGDIATAVFSLTPTPATANKEGLGRLNDIISALGGPETLKKALSLIATGTLRCGAEQKSPQQWQLNAATRTAAPSENASDTGSFELSTPGGKQQLSITRDRTGYHVKSKNRVPKEFDEGQMQACLTALQDGQFAKLILPVLEGSFALSTGGDDADVQPYLRAASPAKTYRITLDAKSRPIEVRYEAAGFDTGLRIVYSEYVEFSGGYLPKRIQVIPPDPKQAMLDVRFADVASSATVPK